MASNPVAACRSSAGTLSVSWPMMPTAMNHVTSVAAKASAGAQCDRPAMRLLRSGHARSDRGEDENAFEPFAKNKHADIEKRDRRAGVRLERIRRAMCAERLPHHHGDNTSDGGKSPITTNGRRRDELISGLKISYAVCAALTVTCDFLTENCAPKAADWLASCDSPVKA